MDTTRDRRPLGDRTVACRKSTRSGSPDELERASMLERWRIGRIESDETIDDIW